MRSLFPCFCYIIYVPKCQAFVLKNRKIRMKTESKLYIDISKKIWYNIINKKRYAEKTFIIYKGERK